MPCGSRSQWRIARAEQRADDLVELLGGVLGVEFGCQCSGVVAQALDGIRTVGDHHAGQALLELRLRERPPDAGARAGGLQVVEVGARLAAEVQAVVNGTSPRTGPGPTRVTIRSPGSVIGRVRRVPSGPTSRTTVPSPAGPALKERAVHDDAPGTSARRAAPSFVGFLFQRRPRGARDDSPRRSAARRRPRSRGPRAPVLTRREDDLTVRFDAVSASHRRGYIQTNCSYEGSMNDNMHLAYLHHISSLRS